MAVDNYVEGREDQNMNISQLKAFLSEKPQHLGGKDSIQNQLRDSGLRQAIDAQGNIASLKADKFSSSATFGVKVFSSALNSSIEVNNQKPDFSEKTPKESAQSLFNFEEVAKNVLNFIGGVITNAKNGGADSEQLNGLFEQASSGVLRGIQLAEKDLAGFMNEEIQQGISSSKDLIEQGIDKLRQQIFNPQAPEQVVQQSLEASYGKLETGELSIRTKDGDRVNIRFEDLQAFELSQQRIQQASEQSIDVKAVEPATSQPIEGQGQSPEESEKQLEPQQANASKQANVEPKQSQNSPDKLAESEQSQSSQIENSTSQNGIFYQQQSLSFSVTGELDEDELKAIGKLVGDANDLADEFFNGDIETAFNQALELGFDEQELTGFALQLTRVESAQVIKAYESVSLYDEGNKGNEDATKAVKPVANYMEKLMDVLDRSSSQLEDSRSYDNIVTELINRLGDVATPDLISAINRFNGFNQKLIDNLPAGFHPQS